MENFCNWQEAIRKQGNFHAKVMSTIIFDGQITYRPVLIMIIGRVSHKHRKNKIGQNLLYMLRFDTMRFGIFYPLRNKISIQIQMFIFIIQAIRHMSAIMDIYAADGIRQKIDPKFADECPHHHHRMG